MKLIIAIVQDEDSARLVRGLMDAGYGVTKLATTGGFLRSGNTTLLVGVEDERFDGAMEVIEKICKSRKQIATSPSPMSGATGVYVPYPIEVVVGGGDGVRPQRGKIRQDLSGRGAAGSGCLPVRRV